MSGITGWLGDSHNPNGEGSDWPRWSVMLRFVVAAGAVAAFLIYGVPPILRFLEMEPWILAAAAGVYLFIGYLMKPRVDTGELEWWQLIFDVPFTYHDDYERNKFLIGLIVLLLMYPGHFISHALVDFVILLVNIGD